jgi:hypothetical protein
MAQETAWAHCNTCGATTNHDVVASEEGLAHEQAADDAFFFDAYDMLRADSGHVA